MEHLSCGTVHEERAFKAENSMLCPTCKKILQNPTEHRVLGTVCSCNKCKAHFEDPSQSFFCRKCEIDFNLTTGIITDVYTYHINDKIIEEVRTQTGLPIIQKALQQDGFEVEMPGRIEGGARQFAIVARRAQKRVAMDIGSNETEIDIEPVLQLFVKALDERPDLSVFAAIPQLSKRGRDVARMHDIRVVEGSSPLEVAHRILEMLKAEPIFIQGQTGTDNSNQKP